MIVFCPNCGTQNPGVAGARATCSACSSTFDVPAEAGRRGAPPPPPPPAPVREAAPAQVFATPPGARSNRKTNTLAVVSFVMGLICCIPLVSPVVSVGCGIGALKQLDAGDNAEAGRALAILGIVFGAITTILQVFWLIGTINR